MSCLLNLCCGNLHTTGAYKADVQCSTCYKADVPALLSLTELPLVILSMHNSICLRIPIDSTSSHSRLECYIDMFSSLIIIMQFRFCQNSTKLGTEFSTVFPLPAFPSLGTEASQSRMTIVKSHKCGWGKQVCLCSRTAPQLPINPVTTLASKLVCMCVGGLLRQVP